MGIKIKHAVQNKISIIKKTYKSDKIIWKIVENPYNKKSSRQEDWLAPWQSGLLHGSAKPWLIGSNPIGAFYKLRYHIKYIF